MKRYYQYCYLLLLALVSLSCYRRELTYSYTPTVEVVVEVDWSDMTTTPTGMSVYCYPVEGGSPTIKLTNSVSSTTLTLAEGEYRIMVFNLTPAEFDAIDFAGLDSYETAEVLAVTTRSSWYTSKADEEEFLASEPEELAIATNHTLNIPAEAIDEVLGLREKDLNGTTVVLPYDTIHVAPQVVVRRTKVYVEVDGIHNFGAARASLTGMATGYDISEQKSHADYATHLLESWTTTIYNTDVTQGNMVTYFVSFGLPETTTATRAIDESWEGTMHLEVLLRDNSTIDEFDFDLNDKSTIVNEDDLLNRSEDDSTARGDDEEYEEGDANTDVDTSIDISLEVGLSIKLTDVDPEDSSSSGGFSPEVSGWEDEVVVQLPT